MVQFKRPLTGFRVAGGANGQLVGDDDSPLVRNRGIGRDVVVLVVVVGFELRYDSGDCHEFWDPSGGPEIFDGIQIQ